MRLILTSVLVDDQAKALSFYTDILGFRKKHDVDMGDARWLTVVSPESEDVELLLEPDWNPQIRINDQPAAQVFKKALYDAGVPCTAFGVKDIQSEYERLVTAGVRFTLKPTPMGPVTAAILDDGCGNLVQLLEKNP